MKFTGKDIELMNAALSEAFYSFAKAGEKRGIKDFNEGELDAITQALAVIQRDVLYPADIRLHAMILGKKTKELARQYADLRRVNEEMEQYLRYRQTHPWLFGRSY